MRGHPYLEHAEVKFAIRIMQADVAELVGDVNDLASHFDRILGITEVAGLATSVASAFGVQADIEREVAPEAALHLAELTRLADAAEQRWGKVW